MTRKVNIGPLHKLQLKFWGKKQTNFVDDELVLNFCFLHFNLNERERERKYCASKNRHFFCQFPIFELCGGELFVSFHC